MSDIPEGCVLIKGTRRPDGTYRKDILRKAGYVPEDEQAKYHDKWKTTEVGVVGGGEVHTASATSAPLSKSAKKNAARKAKREAGGGGGDDDESANGDVRAAPRGGDGDAKPASTAASVGNGDGDANASPFAAEVGKRLRALKKRLRQLDELGALPPSSLNDEQRAKLARRAEAEADLAQLEALAASAAGPPTADGADPAKRLKNLRKKLRAVDELRAKADGGAQLNAEQLAKLGSSEQLAREVDQLAQILAAVGLAAD